MSDKPSFDPTANFMNLVAEWEKLTNSMGASISDNSGFTEALHKLGSVKVNLRQMIHSGMAKALDASNMPSREDVIGLGERIGVVEAQLARIEALLSAGRPADTGPTGSGGAPAPRRTRKPPSAG